MATPISISDIPIPLNFCVKCCNKGSLIVCHGCGVASFCSVECLEESKKIAHTNIMCDAYAAAKSKPKKVLHPLTDYYTDKVNDFILKLRRNAEEHEITRGELGWWSKQMETILPGIKNLSKAICEHICNFYDLGSENATPKLIISNILMKAIIAPQFDVRSVKYLLALAAFSDGPKPTGLNKIVSNPYFLKQASVIDDKHFEKLIPFWNIAPALYNITEDEFSMLCLHYEGEKKNRILLFQDLLDVNVITRETTYDQAVEMFRKIISAGKRYNYYFF